MDIIEARKEALKGNTGYTVKKSYQGKLGNNIIFGFVVSKGSLNRFLVVYDDKTVSEVTGPMAIAVVKALTEV